MFRGSGSNRPLGKNSHSPVQSVALPGNQKAQENEDGQHGTESFKSSHTRGNSFKSLTKGVGVSLRNIIASSPRNEIAEEPPGSFNAPRVINKSQSFRKSLQSRGNRDDLQYLSRMDGVAIGQNSFHKKNSFHHNQKREEGNISSVRQGRNPSPKKNAPNFPTVSPDQGLKRGASGRFNVHDASLKKAGSFRNPGGDKASSPKGPTNSATRQASRSRGISNFSKGSSKRLGYFASSTTKQASPGAKSPAQIAVKGMKDRDYSVSHNQGILHKTDEESIAGFPRDCGLPGGAPYLSLGKALFERSLRHPHLRSDVIESELQNGEIPGRNLDPVPLSTPMGRYNILGGDKDREACCSWGAFVRRRLPRWAHRALCATRPVAPGAGADGEFDLYQFGLAVPMYFKMTKFLGTLFTLMFFLTLPSMILFSMGDGISEIDRALYNSQISINDMFQVTLGNLGETEIICREVEEDSIFDLACPTDFQVITSLRAYYGAPFGDCTCPEEQRTDGLGGCPHPKGSTSVCPNQNNTEIPGFCYLGKMPDTRGPCCSSYLAPNGREGNLTKLALARNPACNAKDAQEVLEGLCLGKNSCTVNATDTAFREEIPGMWNSSHLPWAGSAKALANFTTTHGYGCPAAKALKVTATCFNANLGGTNISKANLMEGLGILNGCILLVFAAGTFGLWREMTKDALELDNEVTKASNYTLKITNLPYSEEDYATMEKSLMRYFEEYYHNLDSSRTDLENSSSTELNVVDINFALPMSTEVPIMRRRGMLARLIDAGEKDLKILNDHLAKLDPDHVEPSRKESLKEIKRRRSSIIQDTSQSGNDKPPTDAKEDGEEYLEKKQKEEHLNTLWTQFGKVTEKLRIKYRKFEEESEKLEEIFEERKSAQALRERHADLRNDFLEARTVFVTFRTAQSADNFRRRFPGWGCLARKRPPHSDYKGHHLRVRRAAEPGDILWEHLQYSFWSRLFRQAAAVAMTFCAMAVAFSFLYVAKKYRASLIFEHPPDASCAGQWAILNPETARLGTWTAQYITPTDVVRDYRWEHYGLSKGNTGVLECFCKQAYYRWGYTEMINYPFTDPTVKGRVSTLCEEWAEDFTMANKSTMIAVFGVLMSNHLLNKVIRRFIVPHEKMHCQKLERKSFILKSFIAQLSIIAGTALAINGNLDYFHLKNNSWIFLSVDWTLLTGLYEDINKRWFLDVGLLTAIIMLSNIFLQHLVPLFEMGKHYFLILRDRGFKWSARACSRHTTQDELEALYTGPDILLEDRHAAVLVQVFVTLIYFPCMPVLVPICATSFISTYFAEKFFFLRLYKSPEPVDADMGLLALGLVPAAIWLHCLATMWVFSNPAFYDPDEVNMMTSVEEYENGLNGIYSHTNYIGSRFFHKNVLFQTGIFFILSIAFGFRLLWRALNLFELCWADKRKEFALRLLFPHQAKKQEECARVPYFSVVPTHHLDAHARLAILKPDILARYTEELGRRKQIPDYEDEKTKMIVGLPTYNWSANPRYLKAYALDSECIMRYNAAKRAMARAMAKIQGATQGTGDDMENLGNLLKTKDQLEYDRAQSSKFSAELQGVGMGLIGLHSKRSMGESSNGTGRSRRVRSASKKSSKKSIFSLTGT